MLVYLDSLYNLDSQTMFSEDSAINNAPTLYIFLVTDNIENVRFEVRPDERHMDAHLSHLSE